MVCEPKTQALAMQTDHALGGDDMQEGLVP
jgi:hypothetical protein